MSKRSRRSSSRVVDYGDESSSESGASESEFASDVDASGYSISSLTLNNFKSYAGEHVIGPFKQFSAIIGPNGAGKSNTMDGLSFVLGVHSATLRGSSLKDLICSKGTGDSASVQLDLEHIDPHVGPLSFRRTVTPSGSSEYFVDDNKVSAKKYTARLESINVMADSRNFLVFQGDVEAVASKTPKEYAALIETVSGSAKLAARYEEALARKKATEEDIVFAFQKKKGINAETKRYKEQAVEAEKYEKLEADLEAARRDRIVWQLKHLALEDDALASDKEEAEKGLATAKAQQAKLQSELAKLKKEQAKHQVSKLKSEASAANRAATAGDSGAMLRAVKDRLTRVEKRSAGKIKTAARLKAAVEKSEAERKALESEMAVLTLNKEQFDKDAADILPEISMVESQREEYNRLKAQASRAAADARRTIASLKRDAAADNEVLRSLENQVQEQERRAQRHSDTVDVFTARLAKLEAFIADQESQRASAQAAFAAVDERAKAAAEAADEAYERLQEAERELRDARAEQRFAERARRAEETLADLKRLFPGVLGRVGDLVKPKARKYSVALATALGGMFDAIVVADERTAIDCIAYLKERRAGVRTFLPLDGSLRPSASPSDALRASLGSDARLALDIAECSDEVVSAVQYVLGVTVVADTAATAKNLCFGRRSQVRHAVVLDGTSVKASGIISGGKAASEAKAAQFDARRIEELAVRREAAHKELVAASRDADSVARERAEAEARAAEVKGAEERIEWAKVDMGTTSSRIAEAKQAAAVCREAAALLAPEIARLTKLAEERTVKLAEASKTANTIEDNIFADFSRSVGVESIREYEDRRLAQALDYERRTVQLTRAIEEAKGKLALLKARDVSAAAERAANDVASDEAEIKKLKAELSKIEKAAKAEKETAKKQATVEGASSEALVELNQRVKQLKSKVTSAVRLAGGERKRVALVESKLEANRQMRHSILQEARLDEVALPLVGEDKPRVPPMPAELAASQSQSQMSRASQASQMDEDEDDEMMSSSQASQGRRRAARRGASVSSSQAGDESTTSSQLLVDADNALQVDLSSVPRAKIAKDGPGSAKYKKLEKEFVDRANGVLAQMGKMAPNMKAGVRLASASERLANTEATLGSNRQEAKEATRAFEQVKAERIAAFRRTYDAVASSIDAVYKDLTRNRAGVAGTAYLSLENAEEPYLGGVAFHAMPPYKGFRDMDQLSGGERTVAALALLFAFHAANPSPFFVLDEVDAALDAQNVAKVANYLRARSPDLQFVVISLKADLFKKSDSLLGVAKDLTPEGAVRSSVVYSLDLTPYAF
mmetsp:Transcript_13954/g.43933  ORF Transcript_13954/g.43933 Transcript_13954/m.43933 type:complete len:1315 (-) Transcript_13954:28-3972(-)